MLTISVPDDISGPVREIASRSGETPENILLRALRAHFPPITAELQAEFDEWELASDEDAAKFEREYERADNG